MRPRPTSKVHEGWRYLLAGALNTALTFILYWLLLPALGYPPAYTVSFVAGIVMAYVLQSRFVFRTRPAVRSALLFPLVYLVHYLVGLGVLAAWAELLQLPPRHGVFAAAAVSFPVTFVLSRALLHAGTGRRHPGQ